MNTNLVKSTRYGANIFFEIILSALIIVIFFGIYISVGYGVHYGFLTLGAFLTAKFAGWIAVVVCFIVIAFLISVCAAVGKYFSKSQ